ncbi:MAG: class I SAM-dependent methyltransferase [Gemmatimonadota bacterium]
MGDYSQAAEFYDLLYSAQKDYTREAELVARLIRGRSPEATSVLDVGCGTGAHAFGLQALGFDVDGVDVEPKFVEIAATKCPRGRFAVGDMRTLDLDRTYDAVVCLFSAIGYAQTLDGLQRSVTAMARLVSPSGVLLIDPWFSPGELTDGYIATLTASSEDVTVTRMSRTLIRGTTSILEFEYLIGSGAGIERRSETHELGLFTEDQMRAALRDAGFDVERIERALRTRGVYVGVRS